MTSSLQLFVEVIEQDVMVDVVEELLQIQIDYPTPSAVLVRLCFAHSLYRTASRSEPVTVIGEVGIEDRSRHLRDGLLYEPVHHGRYAEDSFSFPSRFRDRHALYGARLIAAFQQLTSYRSPRFFEPGTQFVDSRSRDTTPDLPG